MTIKIEILQLGYEDLKKEFRNLLDEQNLDSIQIQQHHLNETAKKRIKEFNIVLFIYNDFKKLIKF